MKSRLILGKVLNSKGIMTKIGKMNVGCPRYNHLDGTYKVLEHSDKYLLLYWPHGVCQGAFWGNFVQVIFEGLNRFVT
jgi:hypothetical protein